MHALMSAGERNGRARLLIAELVARHGLFANWDRQDWAEVIAELPIQKGLSFPVTLAFRNENELLIEVADFRRILTPWPGAGAERLFVRMVDGLLTGRVRIRRHLVRTGRPWRVVLEEFDPDIGWCHLAHKLHMQALPFLALLGQGQEILCNDPGFRPIRLISDGGRLLRN